MVDIIALERLRILTHYRYTIIINQSDAFNSFSTTLKTYRRFPITLQVNVSNVNISANIYPPPLKKNPPLKSSQNNLSNGGSSAVKSLCYIREVKIPRFRCTGTSSIFWLAIFSSMSVPLLAIKVNIIRIISLSIARKQKTYDRITDINKTR